MVALTRRNAVKAVAERSAMVFLLTNAANVVALALAGTGLAIGMFAGPHSSPSAPCQ
jgi:hypothetical protein